MNAQLLRKMKMLAVVPGILVVAAACGEVTAVGDGMGEVQVTLQEATAEALFHVVTADLAAAPGGTSGRVDRNLVRSLDVTIDGVQILPYCEDAGEQNGDGQCEDLWVTLDIGDSEYDLDLLLLPSEEADPIAITTQAEVPVGTYHKVRLFVSSATVTFLEDITVGHSTFLAFEEDNAETVYDVEIPSAQNTGIKADIDVEVEEEGLLEIGLLFDADATFRNVIATGSGRVKMPPVLKARPMNQHQNQNQNQNGG